MMMEKSQLSELVDLGNPRAILKEVKIIMTQMNSAFNFGYLAEVFYDMEKLFRGEYPGYGKSSSRYYDFSGTARVFLTMSRMAHGAVVSGRIFSVKELNIALSASLLHAAGFISGRDDAAAVNLQSALPIIRSIEFMRCYLTNHPYFQGAAGQCEEILFCAAEDSKSDQTTFVGNNSLLFGRMLGAADILGRMADRYYLERLIFLYHEFEEEHRERFKSELDLLTSAIGYYDTIRNRLSGELEDINTYLMNHFRIRWGIDSNLYSTTIEKSAGYLHLIITNYEAQRDNYLRRKVPDINEPPMQSQPDGGGFEL
jgi:hypothetical protein